MNPSVHLLANPKKFQRVKHYPADSVDGIPAFMQLLRQQLSIGRQATRGTKQAYGQRPMAPGTTTPDT